MTKKIMTGCLLIVLLTIGLVGCAQDKDQTPDATEGSKEPIIVTVIRTKTPQLPFDENDFSNNDQRPGNQGNQGSQGNQGNQQNRPDVQEKGDGLELDGYAQLLDLIDRNSFVAPGGWDRHPVDDLFDGVFETTDQGTNKYGTNQPSFTVEWAMDGQYYLDAYAVVTASDAQSYPDRNPQSWTIEGSQDGVNWQILHRVENANLPAMNYTSYTYTFPNDTAYRYYRWNVESTVGNGMFQASELLLYTFDGPREGASLPDYGNAVSEQKAGDPITGDDADAYIAAHETAQQSVVNVYTDAECFGDGPVMNLFDGVYTQKDFEANNSGKMGSGTNRLRIAWELAEPTTISAYAMVTGNDTADWPERNPIAWALYGSNDGMEWEIIDAIHDGKLEPLNFEPYVYEVDSPKEYKQYCLVIERTDGAFQLCEFLMMK